MNYSKNLYRCFDQKLKWHLLDGGCHFLMVALDANSHDKFWLFERTPLFEELLYQFYK